MCSRAPSVGADLGVSGSLRVLLGEAIAEGPEQEPRRTSSMSVQDHHQGASKQQDLAESYPPVVVEDRTTRSHRIPTDQRTGRPSHQEHECSARDAGILVSGT